LQIAIESYIERTGLPPSVVALHPQTAQRIGYWRALQSGVGACGLADGASLLVGKITLHVRLDRLLRPKAFRLASYWTGSTRTGAESVAILDPSQRTSPAVVDVAYGAARAKLDGVPTLRFALSEPAQWNHLIFHHVVAFRERFGRAPNILLANSNMARKLDILLSAHLIGEGLTDRLERFDSFACEFAEVRLCLDEPLDDQTLVPVADDTACFVDQRTNKEGDPSA